MLKCFLKLKRPKKLLCSLNSCGIRQPQTELIALNHSRSLKVSGRGDVITRVAEVAWESSEIPGLTWLRRCIQIRLINHPFSSDFVNSGIDRESALVLSRSLQGPGVVSCIRVCVCVCVCV